MPREVFANRLTRLYLAAGSPPSKSVVRRVNLRSKPGSKTFSGQRLSDWRLGRSVPAKFDSVLPVLSVLIEEAKARAGTGPVDVTLFDLNDWHAVWSRARDAVPAAPNADRPPYRGRESYRAEDAVIFAGRRRVLTDLERLISSARQERKRRLVLLLGFAGSGKSSLLAAGLQGAKDESRSQSIRLDTFSPSELLRAVAELGDDDGEPVLLLIDQAEDLFDRCPDEVVRQRFLDEIDHITLDPARPNLTVVMAFRAEYAAELRRHPLFAETLEERSLTLGPLTEDELREVLVRPLVELGWQIEPALVEVVLRDIELLGLQEETAILRFLAPVLGAVWERRVRQTSTLASYQSIGGIEAEIAANAERAWAELTDYERSVAKWILVSLVVPGPRSAVRDRVPREVLLDEALNPGTADVLIDRLAAAGVLTAATDGVELRNGALLTGWPRLNDWLQNEQEFALLRRRIEADARAWAAGDRSKGLLYRGARLREAADMRARGIGWNRTANEFVRESEVWRVRRLWLRSVAALVAIAGLLIVITHWIAG
ncbi:hypothetical protein ACIP5Y_23325 [Nocardia sp. NPDC088792]|uniref:nSTAND1 domain-containing NTPase n=1 Tax=Nocardia sp. NPDC088792 TaxID=3364332 RepID=UPI0037F11A64